MREMNKAVVEREVQKILALDEFAEKIPADKKNKFKLAGTEDYYSEGKIKQHSGAWIKAYQSISAEVYKYANEKYKPYTISLDRSEGGTNSVLDLSVEILSTIRDTLNHYKEVSDTKNYIEYFDGYFYNFVIDKKFPKGKDENGKPYKSRENPDVLNDGCFTARGMNRDKKLYHAYMYLKNEGMSSEKACEKLSVEMSGFHGKSEEVRLRLMDYENARGTKMSFYKTGIEGETSVEEVLEDKKNPLVEDAANNSELRSVLLNAIDTCFIEERDGKKDKNKDDKKKKSDKEKVLTDKKIKRLGLISAVLTDDNYRLINLYEDRERLSFVDWNLMKEIDGLFARENYLKKDGKERLYPIELEDLSIRFGYSDTAGKVYLNRFYKTMKECFPGLKDFKHNN